MCKTTPSEDEISNFLTERLSNAGTDKIAVVMVGGPGSGKSSGKSQTISYLGKTVTDFVNIDPDEIITKLFNIDTNCYEPAGKINNQSFEKAIQENKNIVFDGTGRNFEWYSKNVIKLLKDKGYNVNLVIVSNNFSSVVGRMKKRQEEEGRHVDLDYASGVYDALKTAIPKYIDLKCDYIDKIYLFDNSDTLKLILHTSCVNGEKKILCDYVSGTCNPMKTGGKNKKRHFTILKSLNKRSTHRRRSSKRKSRKIIKRRR